MGKVLFVALLAGMSATFVASAASINAGSAFLQQGTRSATCDDNGVTFTWVFDEEDSSQIESVVISSIKAACRPGTLHVKTNLGSALPAVIPPGGGNASATAVLNQPAAGITSTTVTITQP